MNDALDMQRERARGIAHQLIQRTPAGSISSIFAGGSLGRGEVWAARIGGTLEVYSDIDLYVVARDEVAAREIRAGAKGMASADDAVRNVRFLRAPDIGVYTRSDLTAQPLRPGTVDLGEHHFMLHGDDGVARSLGSSGAHINAEEALYLLENRALELCSAPAPASGASVRLAMVQSLKARQDVYSAHAIVAGVFTPTLVERASAFMSNPPATLSDAARADVTAAFDAGRDLAAWLADRDAQEERHAAIESVADAWRVLAPRVLRADANVGELVARRCRCGKRYTNARDVVRIRRKTGMSRWRAARLAPAFSRLAPAAALRLFALARVYEQIAGHDVMLSAHFRHVDRLTRAFGFTAGTLDARVYAMHATLT